MQVEITERTEQLIQNLMASGRFPSIEEAIETATEKLIQELDQRTFDNDSKGSQARLWPDPPLVDECISPPCDLPIPPGQPIAARLGGEILPDPLEIE